jgi:hypothetical protein
MSTPPSAAALCALVARLAAHELDFIDDLRGRVRQRWHVVSCCDELPDAPDGSLGTYAIHAPAITKIGAHAFCRCTSLTKIVLPPNFAEIGAHAFCRCTSLRVIVLPPAITEVGRSAFEDCTLLTEVVLAAGFSGTIAPDAFPPGVKNTRA